MFPQVQTRQTCGHRRCACQMLGSSWRPVPWTRFLQLLGLVSFVAAPWGHGLDTHRVWEALMMGSVPVVLSSPLDVLYEQLLDSNLVGSTQVVWWLTLIQKRCQNHQLNLMIVHHNPSCLLVPFVDAQCGGPYVFV
ncbi:unnamed protein product [Durusdinium trenchii]|uniref:Exostosin GT47 domain-containing protein n=1 Tax=Durusdinium trenchii TaxID=1381693 RepID=A0ABP0MDH8_9DINO